LYSADIDEFLGVTGGCHDDTIVLFVREGIACWDEGVIHQGYMRVVLEGSS
jgi:hypothetical protein